jgi:hypothetical protein
MNLLLLPITSCALVEAIGDYSFSLRNQTKSRTQKNARLGSCHDSLTNAIIGRLTQI